MKNLVLHREHGAWLKANFADLAELLLFDAWWVFAVQDNKLSALTPNIELIEYYWNNKLYLHDQYLTLQPFKFRTWANMTTDSQGNSLLSILHNSYNLTDGVAAMYDDNGSKYILYGATKTNSYEFYGNLLNNMFCLKEFLPHLISKAKGKLQEAHAEAVDITIVLNQKEGWFYDHN